MNYIKVYLEEIKKGNIVAPKRIINVYSKLLKELEENKYIYDSEAVERYIYFTENFLKQSKGDFARQPLKLMLFQKAKASAIYGIKKHDGLRRFKEVFDFRARKNGKTTELAGASLYHLIGDNEAGAEVYSVATKLDQAKRTFNEAKNMVAQSKSLSKIIKKRKSDLYCAFTFSTMQALSSDSNTLDGLNSSFICIDELHAIKSSELYTVLKRSISARKQPLIECITTAGIIREGIFDSMHKYACDVADGLIEDESFLPLIYSLDYRNEYQDPSKWEKANPALNHTKSYEYLLREVERAKNDPIQLRGLLCYEFNIIENSTNSWLSMEEILNDETFEMKDIYNTYAIGGCDLSATTDLTCATALIKKRGEDKFYCLQQYFLPEERIKKLDKTISKEAPYQVWADRGLLTICPGNTVDYSMVTDWFKKMTLEHEITFYKIGYDRALAGYWVQEMEDEFGNFTMEKIAQGTFTWSIPMKQLSGLLKDKKINYNKNPMLAWCLSNTGIKSKGTLENIEPVKIHQNKRIDGAVSLLNAYTTLYKYQDEYLSVIGE